MLLVTMLVTMTVINFTKDILLNYSAHCAPHPDPNRPPRAAAPPLRHRAERAAAPSAPPRRRAAADPSSFRKAAVVNAPPWLPRAVVASIFPLCGWVWGAQGFGVAVLSYTLYTAMVWSSGDYAPARWNELMVDQQLDDDEATAGDECPPCPPAGGPLHQRTSKS